MKKNKKIIILISVTIICIITFLFFKSDNENLGLISKVTKGTFIIEVSNSGELKAKKSEKITGPTSLRQNGIWQIKITDLVDEGTYVNEGDYIAQLDKSEVATKLSASATEVDKYMSKYSQTKLDTAIEMRALRDDLINLKYDVEEKEIIFEQSGFEAPAVQRQAEIEVERANRKYKQSVKSYSLKERQNKAKMHEVELSLKQQKQKYEALQKLINELTVKAPKQGMVIYKRSWDGKRITAGSSINTWSPTVATLPDLNSMISKTYVNEIDISKVKKGQSVNITVDAFPDKSYEGTISRIANVGEQIPGGDTKVFEVIVEVSTKDTLLRPAMTTNNDILIKTYDNVLYIPQEAIFSNDSLQYIYLKDGLKTIKQEIVMGDVNENHAIIIEGLKENEEFYLSEPTNAEKLNWRKL